MFCNACGTSNPDGAKFCNKCGANLEGIDSSDKKTVPPANKEITLSQVGEAALIIAILTGVLGLVLGGLGGMIVFFIVGLIGGLIVSYAGASVIDMLRG